MRGRDGGRKQVRSICSGPKCVWRTWSGDVVEDLESAASGGEPIKLKNRLRSLSSVEELGFVRLLVSLDQR